jgi:hypothetical protein
MEKTKVPLGNLGPFICNIYTSFVSFSKDVHSSLTPFFHKKSIKKGRKIYGAQKQNSHNIGILHSCYQILKNLSRF